MHRCCDRDLTSNERGDPVVAQHTGRDSFYVSTGVAALLIVLLGFLPTYWIPVVATDASLQVLVHLHALLFFGWVILFLLQAVLLKNGRVATHRRAGKFVGAWALVTIVAATWLAFETIARDLALIDGTFRALPTLIPLTQIGMFAGFVACALLNTGKPGVHKRCMVLAALVATTPALARLGLVLLGGPSPVLVGMVFLLSNGLILIAAWIDASRSGRVHAVFLYGGLVVLAIRIARIPFAMSEFWRDAAQAIAGLVSRLG